MATFVVALLAQLKRLLYRSGTHNDQVISLPARRHQEFIVDEDDVLRHGPGVHLADGVSAQLLEGGRDPKKRKVRDTGIKSKVNIMCNELGYV